MPVSKIAWIVSECPEPGADFRMKIAFRETAVSREWNGRLSDTE
jgi:hypothetical protein